VEAFKRHGVEYVHPTLRVRGLRSMSRGRSAAWSRGLFRTGAVKILEDPVTCWELCNLEQRGDGSTTRPGTTTTGPTCSAWPP